MEATKTSFLEPDGLSRVLGMFRVSAADAAHQARGKRLLQVLLALAVVGAAAGLTAFLRGHHVMGTTSEVPWGVLIATYVFFVATSTGLSLVGSLGHVFGVQLFEPLAKKATFLALVTLVVGFAVIGTELERPVLLMWLALTSPNPTSPIWWMGTLYGMVTLVVGLDLFFLMKEDHAKAQVTGILGVVLELAANSNLGSVFGLNHARSWWYGPFVPVYFVSTALVSGAALLLLVTYLQDYFTNNRTVRPETQPILTGLGKLLALFLGIMAFFTAWRFIAGVQGAHYHRQDVASAFLTGPLFVSFWFFEVFLGFLVPMTILLGPWRKSPGYLAVAGGLPVASMLVTRFNFVYSGQMFSLKPLVGRLGETMSYSPPFKGNVSGFLAYTPSMVEVLTVMGAVSGAVLLYVAGSRVLKLGREA